MSVSYNFPSNSVIKTPNDMFKNNSSIVSSESHTVNFAHDSTHYFAKSVFMGTFSEKKWFVIQSETESGENPQRIFYVALPLTDDSKDTTTAISKLIKASTGTSPTMSHSIDLNSVFSALIGSGNGGEKGTLSSNEGDLTKKYFIAKTALKANLTGVGELQSLLIPSGGTEVSLAQSHIGWDLSCVLLDEGGTPYENPTTNTIAAGTDNAYTLVLMTLVIMVVSAIYILAPIVYTYLFEGASSINAAITDSAFNWFWFFILMLGAIPPIVLAATSKKATYFLFALTYVLAYFAGTAGVIKSINDPGRVKDGAFATDDDLLKNIWMLFALGREEHWAGYFALFLIISGLVLEYAGMGLGSKDKDGKILYTVGSILYIGTAIGKFIVLRAIQGFRG